MQFIRKIAGQITRSTSGVRAPEVFLISEGDIKSLKIRQQDFQIVRSLASNNGCFAIDWGQPSANLLLKTPEITVIQAAFVAPEILDIDGFNISPPELFFRSNNWLIQEANCSENYVEPTPQIRTFKYEQIDEIISPTSEDLLDPLKTTDVFGYCFHQVNPKQAESESNKSISTQHQSRDKIPDHSPNEWELLQPVLLPPLSLNFSKELDLLGLTH